LAVGVDASHHQVCGSGSQGMMRETGAMQAYSAAAATAAAQPMINSHHQVPQGPTSQYTSSGPVSMPAHQPSVHRGRVVVDNIYANVPGRLYLSCLDFLFSLSILYSVNLSISSLNV